jgi:uncharacterized membrane protein
MSAARNFFTPSEQQRLISAIEEAESHTSGEVRLHIADHCIGDPIEAAQKLFLKLKMHETVERNGVLIYIATVSHKLAIIGDEGIHNKLGTAFWDGLVGKLIDGFRHERRAEAVAECIIECGRQLSTFFPRKGDDRNELSNELSF